MLLNEFIRDQLDDAKVLDIVILNVIGKSSITDSMIICTATSTRHANAIADKLYIESKKKGLDILSLSGDVTGEWVIVDFAETIVHIMLQEVRDLYQLEKLWG